MLVGGVIHPDAVDHDFGQRRLHPPEREDADATAGRQIKSPVRSQIMPGVGVQGACQSVAGAVEDGQSVLPRQKLRLVHRQHAAVLQQPQLAVPVIEVEDAARILLEILQLCKSAVLPVVQAAAGADKEPAAVGILQNTQHHALVQAIVEAVVGDLAVPDGIDAAAVTAGQQGAVRRLRQAEDRQRLHAVLLAVGPHHSPVADNAQAILGAHGDGAVGQFQQDPRPAAPQAVVLVEALDGPGPGVVANHAVVGIGVAPQPPPAVP